MQSLVVRNFEHISTRSHSQPGHRFGVEAALAQRIGSRASEGDVRSEVPIEGVLVLPFDGGVGQRSSR